MNLVSVCVCTYRRPALLAHLLEQLCLQKTEGLFGMEALVVDNDREGSAREVVGRFQGNGVLRVEYLMEPQRGIASARNRAVSHARGEYVAFIDDDEFPVNDWLINHVQACKRLGVDGTLGPVLPRFSEPPPPWVLKGRFHERPRHNTGYRIGLTDARMGNVLLHRKVMGEDREPFRVEFNDGAEDVDFFQRKIEAEFVFVWCDEAPVYETVPSSRCTQAFFLRRALLRGANSLKRERGRYLNLVKSLIALPLYCLSLPVWRAAGLHHYLKYLIKCCDHTGRLLAMVGVKPIRNRDT